MQDTVGYAFGSEGVCRIMFEDLNIPWTTVRCLRDRERPVCIRRRTCGRIACSFSPNSPELPDVGSSPPSPRRGYSSPPKPPSENTVESCDEERSLSQREDEVKPTYARSHLVL